MHHSDCAVKTLLVSVMQSVCLCGVVQALGSVDSASAALREAAALLAAAGPRAQAAGGAMAAKANTLRGFLSGLG